MKRLLALGMAAAVLTLAGCGWPASPAASQPPAAPEKPAAPDQTPPPETARPAQPEPKAPDPQPAVEGFHPPGTRTGTAEVDRVIEAVANGNVTLLASLYQAVEKPCSGGQGSGAPACPDGKPAGTPVKAFPYSWCDLGFKTDRQEIQQMLSSAFREPRHLFAVYRTNQAPGLDGVTPAYALVFGRSLEDGYAPTLYLDRSGALVLLRWGCGVPEAAVPRGADLILAPRSAAAQAEQRQAQAGNELARLVEDEVQQMHYWLRVALKEDVPCGPPCNRDEDFARVVSGVISRCEKVGPDAQMNGYAYNEERHGPVLKPFKAACDTLRNAAGTVGEVRETPEWKRRVEEAKKLLEPAVKVIESRSK